MLPNGCIKTSISIDIYCRLSFRTFCFTHHIIPYFCCVRFRNRGSFFLTSKAPSEVPGMHPTSRCRSESPPGQGLTCRHLVSYIVNLTFWNMEYLQSISTTHQKVVSGRCQISQLTAFCRPHQNHGTYALTILTQQESNDKDFRQLFRSV